MNILTYQIKLLEPTLITALDGDPNSSVALGYLPGSVLRGAIIQRYIQQQQKTNPHYQFDAANELVRTLFFAGQTRFLNGHLVIDGQRTLPAPLSWQQKKGDGKTDPIYDFAYEDASEDDLEIEWKGIKDKFCVVGDSVQLMEAKRSTAVHIARNRHLGVTRRTEETPHTVYRYVSLAAGQTFSAVIMYPNEQATATLTALLGGNTWLGGSRTGGYGRVEFSKAQEVKKPAQWRELDKELEHDDGRLFITLASDALIRDPLSGQYVVSPTAVEAVLKTQLGDVGLHQAFLQATQIGGFNRKWGLPLPQVTAVKMGSVFVFHKPHDLSEEALRQLEQNGIGERRVEGFGRVIINWYSKAELSQKEPETPEQQTVKIAADPTTSEIALKMVNRMLQDQLQTEVAQKANDLGKKVTGINKSQLNRLRMVVQDELYQPANKGRERFTKYLNTLNERQITRKQFERARLSGQLLLKWLEGCFTSDILVENLKPDIPKIGDVKAVITPELAYEHNLRLAEAVLAVAAKEAGDE